MVQLTIPAHLTTAINLYNALPTTTDPIDTTTTPSLDHHTIHRISGALTRAHNVDTYRFSALLKGCSVYTPAKLPKPPPTPEYTALMARLRAEEEARAYAALTQQPFTSANDDEEYTINDLKSHLSIIANILLSVVATSVAVWMVANSWDVPERLALAMTCSLVVAIAEVVVFGGYVRRIEESRHREKKKDEVKEVVKSWEINKTVTGKEIIDVGMVKEKGGVVSTGKEKVGKKGMRKRKN